MTDSKDDLTAVILRERSRLGQFIRQRVLNQADAEDILQDVFQEFVQAYRLSASIEQISAWLFRVARNRIIDRFRKRTEQSVHSMAADPDSEDGEYRLDLTLPAPEGGPDAAYARSVLLTTLQDAIDALPESQRDIFLAHEIEGRSFKEMAAATGVPVNTLLARKRYAVLALRTRLQAAYDELDI